MEGTHLGSRYFCADRGKCPIGAKLRRILVLRSGPEGRVSIRAK
jgi:hypothetical protein